jgi:hypothetical protein
MFAGEPIRLQQNLVFAIVHDIAGKVSRFGMLAYVLMHPSDCITLQTSAQKRRRS